jgi:serine/threonine protein kinase
MVTTRGTTSAAIQQFEQNAKHWNNRLTIDDFELLNLLGQGGEGAVYHAKHIASGLDVALKRIPFNNNWDNEQESRIHIQLQHPNILRLYGMFRDDDDVNDSDLYDSDYDSNDEDYDEDNPPSSCWMILEYCREGTMQQVMETSGFGNNGRRGKNAKEAFVAKALHGILRAIQYMHSAPHHLLHRDIKPINLLYKDGEPLLADFGMCASLKLPPPPSPSESSTPAQEHGSGGVAGGGGGAAAGRNHEFIGTIIYMAPEVLAMDQKYRRANKKKTTAVLQQQHNNNGGGGIDNNMFEIEQQVEQHDDEEWRKGYSYEADAWSLGVTTYELLMGQHPFPIQDEDLYTVEMCRHVENNFCPCDIVFPTTDNDNDKNNSGVSVSPEAQHFILSLVQVDPKKRMSIDEALRHPWILRHNVIKQQQQQHAATGTTMSNQDKENNKAVKPPQQRAAKSKQILASKNIVHSNNNNHNDAAAAAVKQQATTTNMSNPAKENKPVTTIIQHQQHHHGDPLAKSKQMIDSNNNNNSSEDAAVQQVRALFGVLNVNQV